MTTLSCQYRRMSKDHGLHRALKAARQGAGITIERAAAECGCSVRTVARAESGESTPRVPLLQEMARVYGVSFDDLMHEGHGSAVPGNREKPSDGPAPAKKRAVEATKGA